jgi:hypothetical protein
MISPEEFCGYWGTWATGPELIFPEASILLAELVIFHPQNQQ